ncbi:YGR125W, partial [Symbiodinium necroappetens]
MNDLQKIDDQVRHDEEALAFVPTKDKPSFVVQDLLSPVLGSAVLLPYAVSFVGVVAAANASLEKSFPTLLASLLFSQGMTSLVFWRCSQH